MVDNESSKTCTVCGVLNDIANKNCVNCNSYLIEGLQSGNVTIDKQTIFNSEDNNRSFPQNTWFRLLLLGFIILMFYSGLLRTVSDWMLLIFIISISSLIAGMINPGWVSGINVTRTAVLHITLPIILISFILLSVTLKGSTPTFSPIKPVPAVTCDCPAEKVNKDFNWKYDGREFNWHVEASEELLAYDREMNEQINTFYQSNGNQQADILYRSSGDLRKMILSISENGNKNLNIWVNEETNSQWADTLSEQLNESAQDNGYDDFQRAEFILSFIGSAIPYQITKHPQLPAQTVFDNGDCKDKSILLAAILKHLGYRVAFLIFTGTSTNPGHMALGIAFDDGQVPEKRDLSFYEYHGYKYYFAETTSPNWLLGQISVEKPAEIYVID